MLTKEELLEKGLSEADADEIISAFESKEDPENSLQLLEKALNENDEQSLSKAKESEDKDEDEDKKGNEDDYKPEYMKKYMKRYMKENKKTCGKMAKEVGIFGDEMKKAIDEIDTNLDGAVVEMADLKPILDTLTGGIESMAKAIEDLSGQVMAVTEQSDKSFDIMKKTANVTVEQAKAINDFLGQPTGRKGQTSIPEKEMKKAQSIQMTPEAKNQIYTILMKAIKEGDRTAGQVLGTFESAGKDINRLNPSHKRYIGELMQKEVH